MFAKPVFLGCQRLRSICKLSFAGDFRDVCYFCIQNLNNNKTVMTKRILLAAILCVQSVCASVWAQDLELVGEVEDGFLHKPLTDVKITVMNPDSTVVTDSVSFIICMTQSRMVEKVLFSVAVKAEKRDYLLRARVMRMRGRRCLSCLQTRRKG